MTDAAARGARRQQAAASDAVSLPTFLPPTPRRQDSADPDLTNILDAPTTADVPTQHRRADDAAPYVSDSASDVKGEDRPTAGPSPASTGDVEQVRVRPMLTSHQIAAGKLLAETILKAATAMINKRTRVSEDDDRWLMTKQQRNSIASPLGRIVARRAPLPGMVDGDATDVADGVEAVMALVAYVVDQITAERPAAPVYVELDGEDVPAPAGPGAGLSPFDPAYKVG